MSLLITFTLSESDLEYFGGIMRQAREKAKGLTQQQIIDKAEKMLGKVNNSDAVDFIRDRMYQLDTLINFIKKHRK